MTQPPDIERYVERSFLAAERAAALQLIGAAVIHDGQRASPRLIRCALVSSAGDLARLRAELDHLKIDYRDVILGAEYVRQAGEWVRVRDLNEPFPDDA
jgi:hypothetical protein